jgi:hypothetical protein
MTNDLEKRAFRTNEPIIAALRGRNRLNSKGFRSDRGKLRHFASVGCFAPPRRTLDQARPRPGRW